MNAWSLAEFVAVEVAMLILKSPMIITELKWRRYVVRQDIGIRVASRQVVGDKWQRMGFLCEWWLLRG